MSNDTTYWPVQSWYEPEERPKRGTVVVLAGRGEQPSVYQRFGRRLAFDGYRVHAVGDATVDLDSATTQVKSLLEDQGQEPQVLVGSDSGALFALRLLAQRTAQPDAAVLAGLPVPGTAPVLEWTDELEERTSCPAHKAWLGDRERLTPGALVDDRIPAPLREELDLASITTPVLGLHGADDAISPLRRARTHFAGIPGGRLVSISGAKHDVLNDAAHRSVAATVVLFLEALRHGHSWEITRVHDLSIERGLCRSRA